MRGDPARVLVALLSAVAFGCGPSPRLMAADETLAVTMDALEESEQVIRVGEAEAPSARVEGARTAWQRADTRLVEAQGVVGEWRDTGAGELAWVTLAPCLAAALVGLRLTLEAASLDVPTNLSQAETMAAEPAGDECASEPRPTIAEEETSPLPAPGTADGGAGPPGDPGEGSGSAAPDDSPSSLGSP